MPAFPAALLRARRVLNDRSATTEDLAATVAMDARLTMAVMRLANSARFGASDRRFSLAQSIARVGRTELRALVDMLSLQQVFQSGAGDGVDIGAIWRFSLQGAFAARHWAAHLPALEVDRHEAYSVALFRDIGCMHTNAVVSVGDLHTQPEQRLTAERESLGFTHADLSAELLRRWDFPEPIAEALATHHRTDGPPLGLIAHLGDRTAVAVEAEEGDGAVSADPFPALEPRLAPLLPAPRAAWDAVAQATQDDLSAYAALIAA